MAVFRAIMLQRCCAENRLCKSSRQHRPILLFLLHLLFNSYYLIFKEVHVGTMIGQSEIVTFS